MDERFECPHCGEELTAISVELHKLQKNHDELDATLQRILTQVFDTEDLERINERLENNDV